MTEQLDATPEVESEAQQLSAEGLNSEPDSSPEREDNHEEKNTFQDRINKVTAQKYEQQRRAEALEAELEALKAEKPKEPIASLPDEPKPPSDMYDAEAVAEYHRNMAAYNRQVAEESAKAAMLRQAESEKEQRAKAEAQQAISTYAKNAVRDGVDMDKLRVAEQVINQAGISPELGRYIMGDQNGGKIVEYLHDNPALMHEVLAMDPVSAGIKIASEIKPAALSTTPKVTQAPEPVGEIRGGGALDKDDFDRKHPDTQFF